jgi:hypothetical protein
MHSKKQYPKQTNPNDPVHALFLSFCTYSGVNQRYKPLQEKFVTSARLAQTPEFSSCYPVKMKHTLHILGIGTLVLSARSANADIFHYNNFLLGARAQALGGAYSALSDDASGVVVNPAGTAFAKGTSVSLSGVALYQRRSVYQNVYSGQNFEEKARGLASPFFGGLVRLGGQKPLSGITLGFAIAAPDFLNSEENTSLSDTPDAKIIQYRRVQSQRSGTLIALGSLAFALGKETSFGLSAGAFDVDEKSVVTQTIYQGPFSYPQYQISSAYWNSSVHSHTRLLAQGFEANFGIRSVVFSQFSLGVVAKGRILTRQSFRSEKDSLEIWTRSDGKVVSKASSPSNDDPRFQGAPVLENSRIREKKPFRSWPMEYRLGLAWLPSSWFTASLEGSHHTASPSSVAGLSRAAVTNLYGGMEVVTFGKLVFRTGAFTNFDATSERDVLNALSRGETLDFLGVTGGLFLKLGKTEYGAHYGHQWGQGDAEKSPGKRSAVRSRLQVLNFTASQSFF